MEEPDIAKLAEEKAMRLEEGSAQLQQPESFNFRNPDDWAKWKRRFEQFRSALGLIAQDEPRQVNTLLHCAGEEAEDVLTLTGIPAKE